MTPGVGAYSSTLLANGRPSRIDSMTVTLNNIEYPVDIIGSQEWNDIDYKLTQAIPAKCYPEMSFPNATLFFYPLPYAAFTCAVNVWSKLNSSIELSTSLALPPGYEKAIVDSLAVEICPVFKVAQTELMKETARESRAVISRQNYEPLLMEPAFAGRDGHDISNGFIYRGF
jgi:hypothetical protein